MESSVPILRETWIHTDVSSSNPLPHASPSLLLLLICKPPLQQWEAWIPLCSTHSHNASFQYTCTAVAELLTCASWKTTLSATAQCFCAVTFAFSLTDSAHFQSSLGQHFFPSPSFSVVVSYICKTVRFFIPVSIPSWDPWPPKWFFFLMHSLRFTLHVWKFYAFWQMHAILYPLLQS